MQIAWPPLFALAGRLSERFKELAQLFVAWGVNSLWQFEARVLGFRSKSLWRILPKWEQATLVREALDEGHLSNLR